MTSKSSTNAVSRKSRAVLKPRAKRFLLHLANLRGAWPLNPEDQAELTKTVESLNVFGRQFQDVVADCDPVGVLVLREFLRKAWDASDAREREWFIFKFRDYAHKMTERVGYVVQQRLAQADLLPVPPILAATFSEAAALTAQSGPSELSALEQIGFDFLPKLIRKAKRCVNPNCQITPYFFADRNSRKFCSEPCAAPSQREAKLRWWNENRKV